MIGQRFHYLLVTEKLPNGYYRCTCNCGTERTVFGSNLKQGRTRSCGCWGRERFKVINKRHGMSRTPEHDTWAGIRHRCTNPKATNYENYGGRGIKVCDRWQVFENFFEDMGLRPSSKHSIDRIDPNGDYEPGNCRWATLSEQANNKRSNVLLELNGEMLTGAEFARRTGFARCTVYEWTSVLKLTRAQIEERLIARQKSRRNPRPGRPTNGA